MSQERLDQTCQLPVGTRDAVHVPLVVAQAAKELKWDVELIPGTYVKFVDAEFTRFVPCLKNEAHGILNPFLDEINYYDPVMVLLMPGITSPVRHNFDINPAQKEWEKTALEEELEIAKTSDPACAECYAIKNNDIIRW